jgi:hypothetical protein
MVEKPIPRFSVDNGQTAKAALHIIGCPDLTVE